MGQQLPVPSSLRWIDEAQTIMLVELPPALAAESLNQAVGGALGVLDAAPRAVAIVVNMCPVQPPPDSVSHFREMFDHPLLCHPRLELMAMIVGSNRPVRVLTTVFRRLYMLFGTRSIYIVDSLDDALVHIEAERWNPRSREPGIDQG